MKVSKFSLYMRMQLDMSVFKFLWAAKFWIILCYFFFSFSFVRIHFWKSMICVNESYGAGTEILSKTRSIVLFEVKSQECWWIMNKNSSKRLWRLQMSLWKLFCSDSRRAMVIFEADPYAYFKIIISPPNQKRTIFEVTIGRVIISGRTVIGYSSIFL